MPRQKPEPDAEVVSSARDAARRLTLSMNLSAEIDQASQATDVPRSRIMNLLAAANDAEFGGKIADLLLADQAAALGRAGEIARGLRQPDIPAAVDDAMTEAETARLPPGA